MEKGTGHKQQHGYSVINQNSVNAAWNGQPTTLQVNTNISIPQMPNGTAILAATNQSTQNNQGQLSITSGGGQPTFLNLQANANQPTIVIQNWNANNLSLTNISANNNTPVLVQVAGPGMPGVTPASLPIGSSIQLTQGQLAQGNASPQWMQLLIQSNAATLSIVGVIGGPTDNSGNNGYVIAVNASQNTGPGTGVNPPAGYYATTTSNSYAYTFNWGSSLVWVGNFSPSTAQPVSITMRAL
ncbi:MAG: hypothetical protein JO340_16380 [Acidobacteriaceae bacterium]|nr:hypothetical protein [Acidobacteriaceae bacterium]